MNPTLTTYKEAAAAARELLGDFMSDLNPRVYMRHIKRAVAIFADQTQATWDTYSLTPSGAQTYSLAARRMGQIFSIEHEVSNVIYKVRYVRPNEQVRDFPASNTTSNNRILEAARLTNNTLRVYPLVTGGTLRIIYAPLPTAAIRDSTLAHETCIAGGSTTTAVVTALTHGLVANRQGETDYFDGCRLVYRPDTTTAALRGQAAQIESTNEGASSTTLTYAPQTSVAPASGDTFDIEDVLECKDGDVAQACIAYGAARVAMLDQGKLGNLATMLMGDFERALQTAKTRGWGKDDETEQSIPGRDRDATWPGRRTVIGL